MQRVLIFSPVAIGFVLSVWLVAKGTLAVWDAGALMVYAIAISATVFIASFIPNTIVFSVFAGVALTLEVWYLLDQYWSGNVTQEVLIYLLISVAIALLMERGNE